jgi:hypothetical protein
MSLTSQSLKGTSAVIAQGGSAAPSGDANHLGGFAALTLTSSKGLLDPPFARRDALLRVLDERKLVPPKDSPQSKRRSLKPKCSVNSSS